MATRKKRIIRKKKTREFKKSHTPRITMDPSSKWDKWFNENWRPMMGWQYIAVCIFDFLVAPILTGWFAWKTGIPYIPWKPISLSESGLYHLSMLTILGVTAWSRGQEKMKKIEVLREDPDRISLTPPPGFGDNQILPDPAGSPPPEFPFRNRDFPVRNRGLGI